MGGGRQEKETGNQVMKTLVTAIQKGGQGKTFATCHLAFDFQERGLRVAVIDLDTQANASFTLSDHQSGYVASQLFSGDTDDLRHWFGRRENNGIALIAADSSLANLDKMELSQAAASMRASIAALGDFFDVCLIDTAPSLGVAMTAAVLSADYMLSPIEMEAYSLQGMKKMVSVIGNLRKMNPKLRFLGMVPNKVDARKPRHVANLATLQQAYPQLVLPFSVGARDSIAEALGEQMPVWKIKKTAARKATQEVRALANYVFTKMEIAQ
jgi:chromosome partitioning protein